MTQNSCSADKLNLLRQLEDRESRFFTDRTNIFLIWHSILMAGFALGMKLPTLAILLPSLGITGSLIWLYVSHRGRIQAKYFLEEIRRCELHLPEDERVYSDAQNWRKKTRSPILGIPVSAYFTYVLPVLWALTWLLLPILSLTL